MNRELKLQIPESLFQEISNKSEEQGVSPEALCLSLIRRSFDYNLIDPTLYFSLQRGQIRPEIEKVMNSDLPRQEVSSRVRKLESLSLRFIK